MTKYKPLFAYTLKSLIATINALGDEEGWDEFQRQEIISRLDTKLKEIEPYYEAKIRAENKVPEVHADNPIQAPA